jgi:predicted hydrocarbon binding protein
VFSKESGIKFLSALMGFLERHPILIRIFLRPLANFPFISKKMMVIPRAFMGATAFEIHDVDLKNGRIAIGGVDEVITGSKLIHLMHTVIASSVGDDEKNRIMYELGEKTCRWEVSEAIKHGKWAPSVLMPLIFNSRILDEIQNDPAMALFFHRTMNMMTRIISNEGGWGLLEFDFNSNPMKVMLTNSQEARWIGKSDKPVCWYFAGIVAGYGSAISGEALTAREIACSAAGAPKCVFELIRPAKEDVQHRDT